MDSSGGPLIGPIIFAILLLVNFILSGFSAALETVTESYLEQLEEHNASKIQWLLKLKDSDQKLLHAGWFFQLLTSVFGVWMLIDTINMENWIIMILSVIIIYIFGFAVPRLTGKKYANAWCIQLQILVKGLITVSLPFTYILTLAVHLIVRIFGVNPNALEDEVTEDEIISMVNEGHEQGVLDEHEAEMIQNIFELDDKEARDIMTHRKNITAMNGSLNLSEAISEMLEGINSRFPVYDENIDNIIGVIHLRDAMVFHTMEKYDDWLIKDIPDLLRPIKFIPETRSIDLLFRNMQAQKLQMVIVVDEYGETAGLVTMEDILEEIVGNILDEYDEEECFIVRREDGSFQMDGMTPLQDVEDTLGISFEEDDYETLNGYLIYRLDRIPEEGDQTIIKVHGYSFQIMEVENKTIKWVNVTKLPDTEEEETEKSLFVLKQTKEFTSEKE